MTTKDTTKDLVEKARAAVAIAEQEVAVIAGKFDAVEPNTLKGEIGNEVACDEVEHARWLLDILEDRLRGVNGAAKRAAA